MDMLYINLGSSLELPSKTEVTLPNLILIDEVTHFNAIELSLLNEYLKNIRQSSCNFSCWRSYSKKEQL